MANQIGTRTWFIDTPSATPIFSSAVWFESIEWTETAAVGDECVITDLKGNIVFKAKAETVDDEKYSAGKGMCVGLIVPTLVSGVLVIRIK